MSTFTVVVVNAGVSDPSSTRLLADRASQRVASLAKERGHDVTIRSIDLREILPELPAALSSQLLGPPRCRPNSWAPSSRPPSRLSRTPTPSSPPRPSTRPARAVCSRASSRFSTTTFSSASP